MSIALSAAKRYFDDEMRSFFLFFIGGGHHRLRQRQRYADFPMDVFEHHFFFGLLISYVKWYQVHAVAAPRT